MFPSKLLNHALGYAILSPLYHQLLVPSTYTCVLPLLLLNIFELFILTPVVLVTSEIPYAPLLYD
jgi:hypothetical protein